MKHFLIIGLCSFLFTTACNVNDGYKSPSDYNMKIAYSEINIDNVKWYNLTSSPNGLLVNLLYDRKVLVIHSKTHDTILNVEIPDSLGGVSDFHIPNENALMLYRDSKFFVKKNDSFAIFDFSKEFKQLDFHPTVKFNTRFFPSLNIVTIIGINGYQEAVKTKKDQGYLAVCDLKHHSVNIHKLVLPETYQAYHMGPPMIYAHAVDSFLTVSVEFDPLVYIINLKSDSTKQVEISCNLSEIKEDYGNSKEIRRKKQIDKRFLYSTNGAALFNVKTNTVYRCYSPRLPRLKGNGEYYSIQDTPLRIIGKILNTNKTNKYHLPSGQFPAKYLWNLDVNTNKLIYPKEYKNQLDEKKLSIYSIEPFGMCF